MRKIKKRKVRKTISQPKQDASTSNADRDDESLERE
jgi:hypothetical protein